MSQPAAQCDATDGGCVGWDPVYLHVSPGLAAGMLVLSGLPAFALGAVLTETLGRLGISQVTTFMIAMPLLIAAWYYFLGWLVDRRAGRIRSR